MTAQLPQQPEYPVQFSVDYPDRDLNRLTTAFRIFTIIPIAIVIGTVSGGSWQYSYRPVGELPGIAAMAQRLGARAVWVQSGMASDGTKTPDGCWMDRAASEAARAVVESAGLAYIEAPYIADEVRNRGS